MSRTNMFQTLSLRTLGAAAAVALCAGAATAQSGWQSQAGSQSRDQQWGQSTWQRGSQSGQMGAQSSIPNLGIVVQRAPATMLRDSNEHYSGLLVTDVQRGMRGRDAGLQRGDVIVEIDGDPVISPQDLSRKVQQSDGDEVEVVVLRGGDTRTVNVNTSTPRWFENLLEGDSTLSSVLGVSFSDADRDDLRDTDHNRGVKIERVWRDLPGDEAGLERGDIIVEVDGEPAGADRFERVLRRSSGEELRLTVIRDGEEHKVRASIPDRQQRWLGTGQDQWQQRFGQQDRQRQFGQQDRFQQQQQQRFGQQDRWQQQDRFGQSGSQFGQQDRFGQQQRRFGMDQDSQWGGGGSSQEVQMLRQQVRQNQEEIRQLRQQLAQMQRELRMQQSGQGSQQQGGWQQDSQRRQNQWQPGNQWQSGSDQPWGGQNRR